MDRRGFLKLAAGGSLGLALGLPVMAGPFESADFDKLVPADKKLSPDWVRSLFERGSPEVYRGAELATVGMPIGGLCAGELYLGGDGKLWNWDLVNHIYNSGCTGANYITPIVPFSPLDQGFSLDLVAGGKTDSHSLDTHGFSDVSFRGEYPIGKVTYADLQLPVTVELEAFSPFIPLSWADSSLPATVLRYTVKNISAAPVEAILKGRLQNGSGMYSAQIFQVSQTNQIVSDPAFTFLACTLAQAQNPVSDPGVDFEDWSRPDYAGWTVEGDAFGAGPVATGARTMENMAAPAPRVIDSLGTSPGATPQDGSRKTGKLTSATFKIEKNLICFWIGGRDLTGGNFLKLMVEGKAVRTATTQAGNHLELQVFDVRDLRGRDAQIEIAGDTQKARQILVGPISFSDVKPVPIELEKRYDFGSMGLALLGAAADPADAGSAPADGTAPTGTLGRTLHLAPGASAQVDFVLAWYFPNLELIPHLMGRSYGSVFDSALAVARHVAADFSRLAEQTKLWSDTWYDSTLPYWFLDRTFLNTSTLASQTSFRFSNGRFYGWEGVGSCPGTCTHVWHYAQAPARLFPELERSAREMADYDPKTGFVDVDGSIGFRGEFDRRWAADGMAGSILRVYREHQMSADSAFLLRLWPRVKRSIQFLMSRDSDGDGLLDGPQHNTLDADWYGQVAWLSGMYAAALRAGEEMAREAGDAAFADACHAAFAKSQESLVAKLFVGDYFINLLDPAHANTINSGTGCEIDQVLGQGWSWQVGLGRIFPEKETREALQSIWRYNFAPDVGAYRAVHKPGRKYATAGEAGLLMCTFPRADWTFDQASGKKINGHGGGPAGYFNECMNGFEHQAAGHMIAEGMAQEGLAVIRAVHDRYHPSKRNPWNELECGDHYARSMASYGVFIAACGYEHHGPKGHLGFAPRLTPADFRAPFTTAEGWGTYSQKIDGKSLQAAIVLRYGSLRLRTLAFELPEGIVAGSAHVTSNGAAISAVPSQSGRRVEITLNPEIQIAAGGKLDITIV
jgi:non-lysosomal glucosylceramidase